ncbi:succinylglutamate desuccinylase [Silvimonas terrae]|uniref:Succinylglutamate desuccinylase n=1 Tax=Silvimonas terrae TaxID=300266 RepID=A0A840RAG3_9NEIS|nr:succinylglutamate desuccinylase [Silvimonas terrae]MBB5189342.1 succinylglutamate desuccinylase [Silvimonas terrae]
MLDDFLHFTLRNETPEQAAGAAPSGVRWRWLGQGMLELTPPHQVDAHMVLSAGVHGDETAPIEILRDLVTDIANGTLPLAVRVLVLFGNAPAMSAGKRYLDDDLNRLFSGAHRELPQSAESPRAAALEHAVAAFFDEAAGARWHLDLHTAIRPSVFERFALLPHRDAAYGEAVFEWLAALDISAVLNHRERSNTFTYFSSSQHNALAATLELGKVMPFGMNDLTRFTKVADGLRLMLAASPLPATGAKPRIFDVVGQLDKHSERFVLVVGSQMANFTAYPKGTLIASDGDYQYAVTHEEERIVFPNPKVKVGLRAGLMVVERG